MNFCLLTKEELSENSHWNPKYNCHHERLGARTSSSFLKIYEGQAQNVLTRGVSTLRFSPFYKGLKKKKGIFMETTFGK